MKTICSINPSACYCGKPFCTKLGSCPTRRQADFNKTSNNYGIENKIVLVKWRDSVRSSDWEYLEDIDDNVLKCESIGFLIADTEEHITIAQNYGIKPEQVCNLMTIPKCCIDFFEKIEI